MASLKASSAILCGSAPLTCGRVGKPAYSPLFVLLELLDAILLVDVDVDHQEYRVDLTTARRRETPPAAPAAAIDSDGHTLTAMRCDAMR